MIELKVDNLAERLPEIKLMLNDHYQELALNKDKVPLDPRWDIYEVAEKTLGSLLFISINDIENKKLIGYFIGFIEPELHYKSTLGCTMDILYVKPEYRYSGIGDKLMVFLENALKDKKVKRVFLGSKCHKDIGALFIKYDYKLVEMYYSKWIGE